MRKVLFVILVFCLLIDCAISGAANSTGALASSASYTWDEASATKITFTQDAAQVQGSGASAAGAVVTISGAGTYVLSGECADGRVVVDAGKNDTVQLVLNNVTLTCKTTSPIYAKKADTVVLILADGSVNTISDTAGYVFEEGTDEPDATVFVKNNLIISGNGSLTVNGNYRNAIAAKDDLTIYGGNISVTAINDGLRGRDSVTIFDGAITVAAGNDGIKSNNDEDAAKGFIILNGGAFDIKAGRDGIQAETSLTINGGTYTIVTGGGSANAPTRTEEFRGGGWNGGTFVMPQQPPQAGLPIQPAQTESAAETDDSMKALKCGTALTISGGDFTIDAEDDAVHSNADVSVTGGVFEIQSGDDGFHADSALRIDGGDINIAKAYEGLEGNTVDINGGAVYIYATDDAINAAGGSDETDTWGGPMGFDRFSGGAGSGRYIRVTGGVLDAYGGKDGLDANGDIFLDGGAVSVSSQSQGMDGAVDMDGQFVVTGGTLITAGSAQSPASSSSQTTILISYDSQQASGSVITLKDANGETVAEYTSRIAFTASCITSPKLEQGQTYTLFIDGVKRTDITISSLVTTTSDSGGSYSGGGMGGMGGRGGGRR